MEKIRISRAMKYALYRGVLYSHPSSRSWGKINWDENGIDFYSRVSARTMAQLVMLNLVRPVKLTKKFSKRGFQALEPVENWINKVQLDTQKICCPSCGNVFDYADRKRREK